MSEECKPPVEPAGYISNLENKTGWKCPICGRGISPYIQICPCVPVYITQPWKEIVFPGDGYHHLSGEITK